MGMARYPWRLICLFLWGAIESYPQSLSLPYQVGDTYKIIEKHNFRKWENGKYLGAVYREIQGALKREPRSPEVQFQGRFYLLEQSQQGGVSRSPKIEASFPAVLLVSPYGTILSSTADRFPTMRKFPLLPQDLREGFRWQEVAERVLDPDFNGKVTLVPVLVDYRYEGIGTYRNEEGHRISGKYAVRYRQAVTALHDPDLQEVQGTHDVAIFMSLQKGGLRFITESFKEEYRYKTGRSLRLEGTVATFFEGVAPLDINRIAKAFGIPPSAPAPEAVPVPPVAPRTMGDPVQGFTPETKLSTASTESPVSPRTLPDVDLEEKPEGLTLTVKNLRFRPDSAELLPEENARLTALADGLKQIPQKRFLIVGHTADVGNPVGQKKLSLERAKAIVDALVRMGIPQDRFLYEGRGAEEPVAPNTDEANRARNRRVEITILEK